MKIKRLIYIMIGCVTMGLGCIGIILPILPTVPFFLITAFCFAKSSERLHNWFINTNMYKKHLQSFVEKKGMLVKTKIIIITSVTVVMGAGFLMMSKVPVGRIILVIVWICHIIYFIFGVKTIRTNEEK